MTGTESEFWVDEGLFFELIKIVTGTMGVEMLMIEDEKCCIEILTVTVWNRIFKTCMRSKRI